MDAKCSIATCALKAEIECICRLHSKYFCSDHFIKHRNENRNIRHMAQDIWPVNEGGNDICEMCNLNVPSMCCLCNSKLQVFCSDCISLHTKLGVSHSLEPLDASRFIRESQDIAAYLNRKTRVEKFNEMINENLLKVRNYKKLTKNAAERMHEAINRLYEKGENELELVENCLNELKTKASQAQFDFNLDLSDSLYSLINEDNYQKFVARLQSISLFSFEINSQALEKFCENFLVIQNLIPFYFQKSKQISKYFAEHGDRMPLSVSNLYANVLNNQNLEIDRIIGINTYQGLAADLSMIVSFYPKLTFLDLSGNEIGPEGAKILFSAGRCLTNLIDLNVGGNDILDEGCEYLCKCLPCYGKLENLFLYKNGLTEISAVNLAETLPILGNLKLIALNQNTIGDEGLAAICRVLKSLKNLEAIGLQLNQITGKSSKNIGKIIEVLPKLSDLSLDDNNISDLGAQELLRVFPLVKSTLKLYVRNNNISEDLEEKLKESGGDKVLVAITYKIY